MSTCPHATGAIFFPVWRDQAMACRAFGPLTKRIEQPPTLVAARLLSVLRNILHHVRSVHLVMGRSMRPKSQGLRPGYLPLTYPRLQTNPGENANPHQFPKYFGRNVEGCMGLVAANRMATAPKCRCQQSAESRTQLCPRTSGHHMAGRRLAAFKSSAPGKTDASRKPRFPRVTHAE